MLESPRTQFIVAGLKPGFCPVSRHSIGTHPGGRAVNMTITMCLIKMTWTAYDDFVRRNGELCHLAWLRHRFPERFADENCSISSES